MQQYVTIKYISLGSIQEVTAENFVMLASSKKGNKRAVNKILKILKNEQVQNGNKRLRLRKTFAGNK